MNLFSRMSTRRCRGCDDDSLHTHHLTWLGRWRYCGAFRRATEATK